MASLFRQAQRHAIVFGETLHFCGVGSVQQFFNNGLGKRGKHTLDQPCGLAACALGSGIALSEKLRQVRRPL